MGAFGIGKRNDTTYMVSWHDQVGINGPLVSIVFYICDDCSEGYLSPRYYTFPENDCNGDGLRPHDCTGNLCPDCAGPHLEPDQENDPRRPTA